MYISTVLTLALTAIAGILASKQAASDPQAFTLAASFLIQTYLPPSALSALSGPLASAAAAASITGDPTSILYSALEAPTPPPWFASAIPAGLSSNIAVLETAIGSLRPTATATTTSTSSISSGNAAVQTRVVAKGVVGVAGLVGLAVAL